jgi:hypothetical protein
MRDDKTALVIVAIGALLLWGRAGSAKPQPQPDPPKPQPQPDPPHVDPNPPHVDPQPPKPAIKKDPNQIEVETKLAALCTRKYGDTSPASRKKLFDEYDTDHKGELSRAELYTLLSDADVGNWFTRGMWVEGILGRIDFDQSGGLTFDEVEKATNQ